MRPSDFSRSSPTCRVWSSTCQSQTYCWEPGQRQSAPSRFLEQMLGDEALAEGELGKGETHGQENEHEPGDERRGPYALFRRVSAATAAMKVHRTISDQDSSDAWARMTRSRHKMRMTPNPSTATSAKPMRARPIAKRVQTSHRPEAPATMRPPKEDVARAPASACADRRNSRDKG